MEQVFFHSFRFLSIPFFVFFVSFSCSQVRVAGWSVTMDNVHTLYAEPKYALERGKTAVRFIVDKDIGCILTVVPIVKYPDNSSTVVCLVPPAVDGFFDEYQLPYQPSHKLKTKQK